jgi:hypothetical protein
MYLDFSAKFADLFQANNRWALAMQSAELADSIGADDDAVRFAALAIEEGNNDIDRRVRWLLIEYLVVAEAVHGDYAKIVGWWMDDQPSTEESAAFAKGLGERAIVAIALSLAAAKLISPEFFGTLLAAAASACRIMDKSTALGRLWHEAADSLEYAFRRDTSARDLIKLGNDSADSTKHLIAYLGAMLEVSPGEALKAQLAILPWLQRNLVSPRSMYRRLVCEFIRNFWKITFDKARFQFLTPKLTEGAIDEALTLAAEESLLPLLVAVANGLGLKPPQAI